MRHRLLAGLKRLAEFYGLSGLNVSMRHRLLAGLKPVATQGGVEPLPDVSMRHRLLAGLKLAPI